MFSSLLDIGLPFACMGAAYIGSLFPARGPDAQYIRVIFPVTAVLLLYSLYTWGLLYMPILSGVMFACLFSAVIWPHNPLSTTGLSTAALLLGLSAIFGVCHHVIQLMESAPVLGIFEFVAAITLLYLWAAASIVIINTQLILAPTRFIYLWPNTWENDRTLQFITQDGVRIRGTLTIAKPLKPPLVILHHGLCGGRNAMSPLAHRLKQEGYSSLRIDARAHGLSTGAVCTYGQYEADDLILSIRETLKTLALNLDFPIVIVGLSMGGGIALAASTKSLLLKIRSIILLAPAINYAALVVLRTRMLGPFRRFILFASQKLAKAMGQIPMTEWQPSEPMNPNIPILLFHGTVDNTVPFAHSQALARAQSHIKLVPIHQMGHTHLPELLVTQAPLWKHFQDFLD